MKGLIGSAVQERSKNCAKRKTHWGLRDERTTVKMQRQRAEMRKTGALVDSARRGCAGVRRSGDLKLWENGKVVLFTFELYGDYNFEKRRSAHIQELSFIKSIKQHQSSTH